MDISVVFFFTAGLLFLIAGAEMLIRGASRLAGVMGISPLIIGLTVVAFGTSAPEMAVSVMSSVSGRADIALGNVVGSNIFNILLILGISAFITPLAVSIQLVRLDVPIMVGVSMLTLVFGLNGKIGRIEGLFLFLGIVIYTVFLIYLAKRENIPVLEKEKRAKTDKRPGSVWVVNLALIIIGLSLLVFGSRWLVSGAVSIAGFLGVSELIIGLTIVAAGTSLPEVATSIIASLRGERDIAVGNVVGSNIFNILAVLGLSGITAPEGVFISKTALFFDIPVMIAVSVACLPIFISGSVISRREGLLFIAYYAAYLTYLILDAVHHEKLRLYAGTIVLFIIVVTVPFLVSTAKEAIRKKHTGDTAEKS